MGLFLAIDAGGTKTTCLLADETRILGRASTGSIKLMRVGEAEATARKAEMDALLDFDEERVKLAERFGIDADRLRLDRPFPSDILDHVSKHVSR